ncbi:adenine-specific methyltransferase EcoRI family protein [Sharpea azabuensis]
MPFSLAREYVATLMEDEKKFIIISNQNALAYKDIFSLMMNNPI